MAEAFEITAGESRGRAAVVRLRGRLDAGGVQALLNHTSRVLAAEQNLVLNLSQVSFIGSSGVGALLVTLEMFREQGCDVRFVELSAAVAAAIQVLNLDRFLPIEASEDVAISKLAA